jgi:tetratricopeptide (TPR) repeat protein
MLTRFTLRFLVLIALFHAIDALGADPPPGSIVVAMNNTNIYAAVNAAEQIDQIHAGTIVWARLKRGEWIRVGDGVVGWARASQFQPANDATVQKFDAAVGNTPTEAKVYCARGLLRLRLKQREGAKQDFERAIKLDPTYAHAHKGLGDVAFEAGDYEVAIGHYGEALLDDDSLYLAYNNRGVSYLRLERFEDALADFVNATRRNPRFSKGFMNAAEVRAAQGNDDVAHELLAKAVELDSRNTDAHTLQATLYYNSGDYRQAASAYSRCIRLAPKNLEHYIYRGVCRSQIGEQDGAIEDWSHVLEKDPDNIPSLINRGQTLLDRKKHKESQTDLRRAVRLEPTSAAAHALLGVVEYELGEKELGIKRVRQSVQLDEKDAIAQAMLAKLLLREGTLEESTKSFNAAIKANPRSPSVYLSRGDLHYKAGRLLEAIADADAALQIDPESADAYALRAAAYTELGQHQQAAPDYTAAIQLDPKNEAHLRGRVQCWLSLGMIDEAFRDNLAALQIDPKSAISYRQRGDIHVAKSNLHSALRAYNRALELDQGLSTALEGRSRLYLQTGDFDKAIKDQLEAVATSRDKRRSDYAMIGAYRMVGETDKALQLLDTSIEQYPTDATALLHEKALMELDHNNFDSAIEALHGLSEEGGSTPSDSYLLATALEIAGKQKEAAELYESLARSQPNAWEAWLRLAQMEIEKQGDAGAAVKYAKEACRKSRYSIPEPLAALAAAFYANGQRQEAVQWQSRAIARLPLTTLAQVRLQFAQKYAEYSKPSE